MKKRILEPGFSLCMFVLLAFVIASVFFSYYLAAAESVVLLVLFLYGREAKRRRRLEIVKYMESLNIDIDKTALSMSQHFPLPLVIVRLETGEIIWSNEKFHELVGETEHLFSTYISDVIPDFSSKWVLEGKTQCPVEIPVQGKFFTVFAGMARAPDVQTGGLVATFYWVDVTQHLETKKKYADTRPVVCIIIIDNYEELMKGTSDLEKSAMLSSLDRKLSDWIDDTGGIIRKFERDRMFCIFEQRHLRKMIEDKFSVLDGVHEIRSPDGMIMTISIGIGQDAAEYSENYQQASLAIDMALSRGGDQAVIKNPFNFEFFGGRSKEHEKRTKVKSRVMAKSLGELISASSFLLIMGHKSADADCIGASAGVLCAARKRGKAAYIVCDRSKSVAGVVIDRLLMQPEYADVFISPQDAILWADKDTLLVVVDTNRPDYVESPQLMDSIQRVAVIDHHRRAASYIENAALSFHEPYASSACELVTELLQYLVEPVDIFRYEAEALLSGIMIDTKYFSARTGVRTFEAAAYLRRAGADTLEIKRMFQNDLPSVTTRYEFIKNAEIFFETILVSAIHEEVDRIVASQSADELLNISNIQASFVIYPSGQQVIVSGRSMGAVNVQLILEKLGGGGHLTMAGSQMSSTTVDEVRKTLIEHIEDYIEENE